MTYVPHQFWDSHADHFVSESIRYSLGMHHTRLAAHLTTLQPDSILLVGVGFGREVPLLMAASPHVNVVDVSYRMIGHARGNHPQVTYTVANVAALPFPAGTFTVAITFACLIHVSPAQIGPALDELTRVAKNVITVEPETSSAGDAAGEGVWMDGETNTWRYEFVHRFTELGLHIQAYDGGLENAQECALTWASHAA